MGITWDGTNFYVIGASLSSFMKYSADGTFIANVISAYAQEASVQGIVAVGTDLWMIGLNNDTAYKYQPQIGCGARLEGTGNNLYTRIK